MLYQVTFSNILRLIKSENRTDSSPAFTFIENEKLDNDVNIRINNKGYIQGCSINTQKIVINSLIISVMISLYLVPFSSILCLIISENRTDSSHGSPTLTFIENEKLDNDTSKYKNEQ